MPRLYQLLWSLAILFIIVTTVIFSFGILLIGAALASLYGLYRYYFGKKRPENSFRTRTTPREYTSGEVIDMPVEIGDNPSERPRN